MKIPYTAQLEKACSDDKSRATLNFAYLDKEKARLMATDSRIMAIVPVVVDENDSSGSISQESLKNERKKRKTPEVVLRAGDNELEAYDGQKYPREKCEQWVNPEAVMPKDAVQWTVSLDPVLLLNLAQALGAERGVRLEIFGVNRGIRVCPVGNPWAKNKNGVSVKYQMANADALGIIMPLRDSSGGK